MSQSTSTLILGPAGAVDPQERITTLIENVLGRAQLQPAAIEVAQRNGHDIPRVLVDVTGAAVDSLDDRPDHQRLSARVFDQAYAMARGFGVPFKVVTVSPDPGLSYSLAGALPSYVETTKGLAAQSRQQLEALIQRFGVVCDEVLVLRGMADRQLAAAMSGNGLLVIGGCSNRGLKGRLLGNVAERVLHYVDGNILVVA